MTPFDVLMKLTYDTKNPTKYGQPLQKITLDQTTFHPFSSPQQFSREHQLLTFGEILKADRTSFSYIFQNGLEIIPSAEFQRYGGEFKFETLD